MLSGVAGRVARVTFAVALLTGAGTITILAHEPSSDLQSAVRQCLDSHDQNSDYCANAIALSGMNADEFWPMVAFKAYDGAFKVEKQKEQPKPDLFTLLQACADTHDRASDECARAQEATGLGDDDFWAKMHAKFGVTLCENADDESADDCWPASAQGNTGGTLPEWAKDCFTKYAAALAPRGTSWMADQAADACGKAVRRSGLTPRQFFAKYGLPQAAKN